MFLLALIAFNVLGWFFLWRYQRHLDGQINTWNATFAELDPRRRARFRKRGKSKNVQF